MKQWICATVLCLAATPAAAFDINAGISGSWFNPSRDGHGFAIEYFEAPGECAQGCLVVYWFTYTPEGEPLFLLGSGPVSGNTATLELLHFSGQSFGSFMPAPGAQTWGTLELTFSDCNTGTASYQSEFESGEGAIYGDGEFGISRLASVGSLTCSRAGRLESMPAHPAGGVWLGEGFSGDLNPPDDQLDNFQVVAIVLDSGEAFLFWPEPAMYRGMLNGDGVDLAGRLDAYAGFPAKLVNGNNKGKSDVALAGAAELTIFGDRNGRGRAGDFLEGHFNGVGMEGDFRMRYQASSGRPPTMDRIAQCWQIGVNTGISGSTMAIAPTGEFSVTLNLPSDAGPDCEVQGTVRNDLVGWNAYRMEAEVSGCNYNGSYDGVASVLDLSAGDDAQLVFGLDNGTLSLSGVGGRLKPDRCD